MVTITKVTDKMAYITSSGIEQCFWTLDKDGCQSPEWNNWVPVSSPPETKTDGGKTMNVENWDVETMQAIKDAIGNYDDGLTDRKASIAKIAKIIRDARGVLGKEIDDLQGGKLVRLQREYGSLT
jgi:hypothetical protein